MSDTSDSNRSADLAAYSVMRAVLRSRIEGTDAARPGIERIVDDLQQRYGNDAVMTMIGSLALKALWPVERRAHGAGTTTAAELDADEQRVLAMLDRDRRSNE